MRLDKKSQKKKKARPDFAKIKIKTCFSIKFCKKIEFKWHCSVKSVKQRGINYPWFILFNIYFINLCRFIPKNSRPKNEGEIPQYYVTGSYEAIIPVATFNSVQRLIEQRATCVGRPSYMSIYSSKIKCGCCGGWYGSKVWHSNSKYRQVIWQCNNKFQEKCTTPNLTEEEIQDLFVKAANQLVRMKKEII